jgi:hypothetical protein
MKTQQEIFDVVATHLLKQNAPSKGDKGLCMYRGPNGKKCAVGYLIPDSHYDPNMESMPIYSSIIVEALRANGIDVTGGKIDHYGLNQTGNLLRSTQITHDTHPVRYWGRELTAIANQYGLDPKVILDFKSES